MAVQQPDRHWLGSTVFPARNVHRIHLGGPWQRRVADVAVSAWHPGIRPSCRGPNCSRAARLTARAAVKMLTASGVHAVLMGEVISIGEERWRVAAACGGINYLVASMAVGYLYAGIVYRQWRHRLAFLLGAAVVPLVGNALRVHTTILLDHLGATAVVSGMKHELVRGVRVRHHDGRAIRDLWTLARGSGARTPERSRATTPGPKLSLRRAGLTLRKCGAAARCQRTALREDDAGRGGAPSDETELCDGRFPLEPRAYGRSRMAT